MSLQELIKDAAECADEVTFRNGYSGRGMYGKKCVGIVGTMINCMAVIAEVIKTCKDDEDFDEAVDTLLQFTTDNMGWDVIVYWEELEDISLDDEVGDGLSDAEADDLLLSERDDY